MRILLDEGLKLQACAELAGRGLGREAGARVLSSVAAVGCRATRAARGPERHARRRWTSRKVGRGRAMGKS